jgi:hypothetical protein
MDEPFSKVPDSQVLKIKEQYFTWLIRAEGAMKANGVLYMITDEVPTPTVASLTTQGLLDWGETYKCEKKDLFDAKAKWQKDWGTCLKIIDSRISDDFAATIQNKEGPYQKWRALKEECKDESPHVVSIMMAKLNKLTLKDLHGDMTKYLAAHRTGRDSIYSIIPAGECRDCLNNLMQSAMLMGVGPQYHTAIQILRLQPPYCPDSPHRSKQLKNLTKSLLSHLRKGQIVR